MDRIDDTATTGLAPPDQEPRDVAPAGATPHEVAPAEQDEQTRARLLRAAVDVFDRKGYAAASVREIVERAGVSKPALYYHFGSKEGVLLAIIAEAMREFEAAVARGVRTPGTARDRLFTMCDEVYTLLRRNVPVVRVAHAISFGPVEGAPSSTSPCPTASTGPASRVLKEGVAAGEYPARCPSSTSS